jgi:hypothetical protein
VRAPLELIVRLLRQTSEVVHCESERLGDQHQ